MEISIHKSLYGLKQASRKWYSKLSSFVISIRYRQSQADHLLYSKQPNTNFTALLVYVDDIVLAGTSLSQIKQAKHLLHQTFKIKDLGRLRFFLGFEISRTTTGIFMHQKIIPQSFLKTVVCLPLSHPQYLLILLLNSPSMKVNPWKTLTAIEY